MQLISSHRLTMSGALLAATGSKTASKDDMITWAVSQYSDANWLTTKRGGHDIVTKKNEHLADAVAAVHAGMKTDLFQQLTAFNKRIA